MRLSTAAYTAGVLLLAACDVIGPSQVRLAGSYRDAEADRSRDLTNQTSNLRASCDLANAESVGCFEAMTATYAPATALRASLPTAPGCMSSLDSELRAALKEIERGAALALKAGAGRLTLAQINAASKAIYDGGIRVTVVNEFIDDQISNCPRVP